MGRVKFISKSIRVAHKPYSFIIRVAYMNDRLSIFYHELLGSFIRDKIKGRMRKYLNET